MFSPREQAVKNLLDQNFTQSQIARKLGISRQRVHQIVHIIEDRLTGKLKLCKWRNPSGLTEIQEKVFSLLLIGYSPKQIAEIRNRSLMAIYTTIHQIERALSVSFNLKKGPGDKKMKVTFKA